MLHNVENQQIHNIMLNMSTELVKSGSLLVKSYGTKYSGLESDIQYFQSHICVKQASKRMNSQICFNICTNHWMVNSKESQLTWFVEKVCKTNKSIRWFHV